jgi:hypothetical protein
MPSLASLTGRVTSALKEARVAKESEVDSDYGGDESEVDFPLEMERRFARARKIEQALAEEGSKNLYDKVVNVLWRNFESAILSGAPPPDAADTFLENDFQSDYRSEIRRISERVRRQTEGSKQADSAIRKS